MNVDLGIWTKLLRLVVFLIIAATLLGVAMWYRPLIQQNEKRRRINFDLEAKIQRVQEENRRIEGMIHALQNDPKTVERAARERLNMHKPGETVIRFEDAPLQTRPGGLPILR